MTPALQMPWQNRKPNTLPLPAQSLCFNSSMAKRNAGIWGMLNCSPGRRTRTWPWAVTKSRALSYTKESARSNRPARRNSTSPSARTSASGVPLMARARSTKAAGCFSHNFIEIVFGRINNDVSTFA